MTPVQEHPAANIILKAVKDELFPVINKLKDLLVRVQKCRVGYIYSAELNGLDNEYSDTSAVFFLLSKKMTTPDILFKDLIDKRPAGSPPDVNLVVQYQRFEVAFAKLLDEGVAYTEIIDRTLDRKKEAIQNSRTMVVAIVAIVIGLFGNLIPTKTEKIQVELIQPAEVNAQVVHDPKG